MEQYLRKFGYKFNGSVSPRIKSLVFSHFLDNQELYKSYYWSHNTSYVCFTSDLFMMDYEYYKKLRDWQNFCDNL